MFQLLMDACISWLLHFYIQLFSRNITNELSTIFSKKYKLTELESLISLVSVIFISKYST